MASGDHRMTHGRTLTEGRRAAEEEEMAKHFHRLMHEAATIDSLQPQHQHAIRLTRTLLNQEIRRVWDGFRSDGTEKHSRTVRGNIEERVAVPQHAGGCNLIGRILGPRGMSVKQLEQESGCKILVRGKGSVKNADKERHLIGRHGWEHLSEPLHVLVTAVDDDTTARRRVRDTADRITKLLNPTKDDEYKRQQLMQLAIINGTYRPAGTQHRHGTVAQRSKHTSR